MGRYGKFLSLSQIITAIIIIEDLSETVFLEDDAAVIVDIGSNRQVTFSFGIFALISR